MSVTVEARCKLVACIFVPAVGHVSDQRWDAMSVVGSRFVQHVRTLHRQGSFAVQVYLLCWAASGGSGPTGWYNHWPRGGWSHLIKYPFSFRGSLELRGQINADNRTGWLTDWLTDRLSDYTRTSTCLVKFVHYNWMLKFRIKNVVLEKNWVAPHHPQMINRKNSKRNVQAFTNPCK